MWQLTCYQIYGDSNGFMQMTCAACSVLFLLFMPPVVIEGWFVLFVPHSDWDAELHEWSDIYEHDVHRHIAVVKYHALFRASCKLTCRMVASNYEAFDWGNRTWSFLIMTLPISGETYIWHSVGMVLYFLLLYL